MSELSEPIWVISWSNGCWPLGYGITYAEAEKARETAINERPGVDFTIVTFEAAIRRTRANDTNSETV